MNSNTLLAHLVLLWVDPPYPQDKNTSAPYANQNVAFWAHTQPHLKRLMLQPTTSPSKYPTSPFHFLKSLSPSALVFFFGFFNAGTARAPGGGSEAAMAGEGEVKKERGFCFFLGGAATSSSASSDEGWVGRFGGF
ncbi:hypothetical protein MRB53_016524 [Persea americana]|uniref:Uncharacterized protein n=1 Tax=Persea americana TaxID=3435 RepID=A0ACC2M2G6_PERAE|nr:hypothetical protein MRB53_016524 [Persea americana]